MQVKPGLRERLAESKEPTADFDKNCLGMVNKVLNCTCSGWVNKISLLLKKTKGKKGGVQLLFPIQFICKTAEKACP